jgi:hypothetical protein
VYATAEIRTQDLDFSVLLTTPQLLLYHKADCISYVKSILSYAKIKIKKGSIISSSSASHVTAGSWTQSRLAQFKNDYG